MAKQDHQQQQLFASPQVHYGWKSVQAIERGEQVVVMGEQVVRVLSIRQENNYWFVAYTDPTTNTKAEQFYSSHDFIYAKMA